MLFWTKKRSGSLVIPSGLTALLLTFGAFSGCSTRAAETRPVLVFAEDVVDRYEANESIPSRPFPCVVMSVKKFKQYTNP